MRPKNKFEELAVFQCGYTKEELDRWLKVDLRKASCLEKPWELTMEQVIKAAEICQVSPEKMFWTIAVDLHRAGGTAGGAILADAIVKKKL